jgi:hypothetical protein
MSLSPSLSAAKAGIVPLECHPPDFAALNSGYLLLLAVLALGADRLLNNLTEQVPYPAEYDTSFCGVSYFALQYRIERKLPTKSVSQV